MGASEIHQYQSALLGIINTTMSTKVTGNYSMTHDRTRRMNYQKKLSMLKNIQIRLKTHQSSGFLWGGGGRMFWGDN